LLRQAVELRRKRLGSQHPLVAEFLCNLAAVLRDAGKLDEAESLARECLVIQEQKPDDWRTSSARCLLGSILLLQKQYVPAEPMLLAGYSGLEQREERNPAESIPRLRETGGYLVQLYELTGQTEEATTWKAKLTDLEQAPAAKTVPTSQP